MKKFCLFLAFLFLGSVVWADYVSLYIQNDVFLPNKSDKYYSHGTRIEYGEEKLGYAIGQYMYTPSIITQTNILFGDRPWCGWLYGSVFKDIYRDDGFADSFELQIGAVGDYSFCEETQTFIHKTIGSRKPMGWDNQIDNELCANLYWQEKYRIVLAEDSFDLIPQGGIAFGNFYIGANVGLGARLGYNLPPILNQKSIEPAILTVRSPIKYAYAFAKMNGRYVAHNITINGSLFNDDSPYVADLEPFVLDVEYGVCFMLWNLDMKISVVDRSNEFKAQLYDEEFAAITVSYLF